MKQNLSSHCLIAAHTKSIKYNIFVSTKHEDGLFARTEREMKRNVLQHINPIKILKKKIVLSNREQKILLC